MSKYQDAEIVKLIVKKTVQQGMSQEMVSDALGQPAEVSTNILKTKKKETWKYHRVGSNRYLIKVFLEDDIVVGWETK